MSFFPSISFSRGSTSKLYESNHVRSTLLFAFEMSLTHTQTQWQMVDSTCVYSLWFFSSFRFECLAIWLQWKHEMSTFANYSFYYVYEWMLLMLHATMSKCTLYNCICCAMFKYGTQMWNIFYFSNCCLWHCMNAHYPSAQNNAKRKMLWHQSLLLDCRNVILYCAKCDSMHIKNVAEQLHCHRENSFNLNSSCNIVHDEVVNR